MFSIEATAMEDMRFIKMDPLCIYELTNFKDLSSHK
jgi:hypothetical protein